MAGGGGGGKLLDGTTWGACWEGGGGGGAQKGFSVVNSFDWGFLSNRFLGLLEGTGGAARIGRALAFVAGVPKTQSTGSARN